MLLAIVLKLVPTIATTVLASLVNAALLALITQGSSAGPSSRSGPTAPVLPGRGGRARTPTRRRKPARSRGSRGAQEDLVSLRRRAPRRVA
jgi:hypothetical protein